MKRCSITTTVCFAIAMSTAQAGEPGTPTPAVTSATGIAFHVEAQTATINQSGSDLATVQCDDLSITLTHGPMSTTIASPPFVLVDLDSGEYAYKATCLIDRERKVIEGTIDVAAGTVAKINHVFAFESEVMEAPIETVVINARPIAIDPAATTTSTRLIYTIGDDLDAKPCELTVLADLSYLTSKGIHQNVDALRFTDLGIWSIAAAYTPRPWLTLGAKTEVLATAPATMNLRTLQSASASLSYSISSSLALNLAGQWHAGLAPTKDVISAGADLTWRKHRRRFLKTEVTLGGQTVTHRSAPEFGGTRTSVLATASADVQICWGNCDQRYGATWLGFDSTIPLFNSNARSMFVGSNPNSSLGFHLGSFARINDTFDLYTALAWGNRGDAIVPPSEFGTLSGGFDQFTITIGAVFHFYMEAKQSGHGFDDALRL
jgi:hypothetical protein